MVNQPYILVVDEQKEAVVTWKIQRTATSAQTVKRVSSWFEVSDVFSLVCKFGSEVNADVTHHQDGTHTHSDVVCPGNLFIQGLTFTISGDRTR